MGEEEEEDMEEGEEEGMGEREEEDMEIEEEGMETKGQKKEGTITPITTISFTKTSI